MLDFFSVIVYTNIVARQTSKKYGCIAQLARALGSYPKGRRFESHYSHLIRPVGQEVKTTPFHGVIMGSIPVRVIKV